MANLRGIRMRIKSVESTRQITKSMKMVAAAKLRKTQVASDRLQSFAGKAEQILRDLGGVKGTELPLLQPNPAPPVASPALMAMPVSTIWI
jgi:F-type H+-transporting ATPase subunit gamma